ncbi:MAG: hypothetical protein QOI13_3115 [Paraburkholderia sp.]|jgi:hypothetical protein|nr:hypothetical protein [Paraburkholderia sp.]
MRADKGQLGGTWDELATASGVNRHQPASTRALKTYRVPDTSKNCLALPDLDRGQIARRLVQELSNTT